MSTTTIKTADLAGPALDWAVAKAEGAEFYRSSINAIHARVDGKFIGGFVTCNGRATAMPDRIFCPHRSWEQGGPIIEQIQGFELKCWLESKPESRCEAHIHNYDGDWIAFGPTPLIAAMRAYVASKLGSTIEIPAELVNAA